MARTRLLATHKKAVPRSSNSMVKIQLMKKAKGSKSGISSAALTSGDLLSSFGKESNMKVVVVLGLNHSVVMSEVFDLFAELFGSKGRIVENKFFRCICRADESVVFVFPMQNSILGRLDLCKLASGVVFVLPMECGNTRETSALSMDIGYSFLELLRAQGFPKHVWGFAMRGSGMSDSADSKTAARYFDTEFNNGGTKAKFFEGPRSSSAMARLTLSVFQTLKSMGTNVSPTKTVEGRGSMLVSSVQFDPASNQVQVEGFVSSDGFGVGQPVVVSADKVPYVIKKLVSDSLVENQTISFESEVVSVVERSFSSTLLQEVQRFTDAQNAHKEAMNRWDSEGGDRVMRGDGVAGQGGVVSQEADSEGESSDNEVDHNARIVSLRARKPEDRHFEDEVDVPMGESARVFLQGYRSIQGRTDVEVNLSEGAGEFASLLCEGLEHKKQPKNSNKASSPMELCSAPVRRWCTLILEPAYASPDTLTPLDEIVSVISLSEAELCPSLMHASVTKSPSFGAEGNGVSFNPIPAGAEVLVHCGVRRFRVPAIFSEEFAQSANKSVSVARLLRTVRPEKIGREGLVMSFFAPHCPDGTRVFVTATAESPYVTTDGSLNQSDQILFSGSIASSRVNKYAVYERIVLAGYPHRISGCSATVKYMFLSPKDVEYFKSVPLQSMKGGRGVISEPLGTHGMMKVKFDEPLKHDDVVYMSLYRRQFPEWSWNAFHIRA